MACTGAGEPSGHGTAAGVRGAVARLVEAARLARAWPAELRAWALWAHGRGWHRRGQPARHRGSMRTETRCRCGTGPRSRAAARTRCGCRALRRWRKQPRQRGGARRSREALVLARRQGKGRATAALLACSAIKALSYLSVEGKMQPRQAKTDRGRPCPAASLSSDLALYLHVDASFWFCFACVLSWLEIPYHVFYLL